MPAPREDGPKGFARETYAKCETKFDDKCAKAETQGDCSAGQSSCADFETLIDNCVQAALDDIGTGATTTTTSTSTTTTSTTTTSTTTTSSTTTTTNPNEAGCGCFCTSDSICLVDAGACGMCPSVALQDNCNLFCTVFCGSGGTVGCGFNGLCPPCP